MKQVYLAQGPWLSLGQSIPEEGFQSLELLHGKPESPAAERLQRKQGKTQSPGVSSSVLQGQSEGGFRQGLPISKKGIKLKKKKI